jgi:hypothetical protein
MTRPELLSLLLRLAAGTALALAVVGLCSLFGLGLPLPLPLALGLVGGAVSWMLEHSPDHADQVDAPALDLDVDYALPHASDPRVRRLEDMAWGAQPRRAMTSRALARTLAEIARERDRDPDAPPIDRRTLHRHLHQLADGEERER